MTLVNESLPQESAVPRVVYGGDAAKSVVVDPAEVAATMRELGISEEGIKRGTIFVDDKNRLAAHGTHYPNKFGRLRFITNPELRAAEGDIVRISTTVKGKPRTEELMNRTLVHELEHHAQQDRNDPNLKVGHIAIWGMAAAGALLGNRLGSKKLTKTAGTTLGAIVGHSIGYTIAPHERQARKRSGQPKWLEPEVATRSVRRHD